MTATAGVAGKQANQSCCYGRRSYAGDFSGLSATGGVVLLRITIYLVAYSYGCLHQS